ncbi:hypothetical protein L2E82_35523 [Cichorium intybus]|uniref:Uncharacterized protein n=1 Tax=Cichorium intybus TaxID=13427 RepID=A0ACB9BP03_CICIN|nr:hypothetical protein L2E82_35523 [Cichorium intybus]
MKTRRSRSYDLPGKRTRNISSRVCSTRSSVCSSVCSSNMTTSFALVLLEVCNDTNHEIGKPLDGEDFWTKFASKMNFVGREKTLWTAKSCEEKCKRYQQIYFSLATQKFEKLFNTHSRLILMGEFGNG